MFMAQLYLLKALICFGIYKFIYELKVCNVFKVSIAIYNVEVIYRAYFPAEVIYRVLIFC